MERQPRLEGERLLLRPLAPQDWDALHAAASDPLIWAGHPASDRWQEPVFRAFFADALASGDFQEKVRDAFPYEDWDKPFSEFTAAKAVQMSLPED